MAQKRYGVDCATAAGLDLVGDRWTLLILRELSFGAQRFTDLQKALPGIASNLLAERLRDLSRRRLIEQRELRAPAARMVYALTPDGERVRPVLTALERFGMPYFREAHRTQGVSERGDERSSSGPSDRGGDGASCTLGRVSEADLDVIHQRREDLGDRVRN